ncbi:unnamed protein product [Pedinophyceae sp. YPF-701]|nr:unnamed protein product [Pedinophyceae sp. YPF-701]
MAQNGMDAMLESIDAPPKRDIFDDGYQGATPTGAWFNGRKSDGFKESPYAIDLEPASGSGDEAASAALGRPAVAVGSGVVTRRASKNLRRESSLQGLSDVTNRSSAAPSPGLSPVVGKPRRSERLAKSPRTTPKGPSSGVDLSDLSMDVSLQAGLAGTPASTARQTGTDNLSSSPSAISPRRLSRMLEPTPESVAAASSKSEASSQSPAKPRSARPPPPPVSPGNCHGSIGKRGPTRDVAGAGLQVSSGASRERSIPENSAVSISSEVHSGAAGTASGGSTAAPAGVDLPPIAFVDDVTPEARAPESEDAAPVARHTSAPPVAVAAPVTADVGASVAAEKAQAAKQPRAAKAPQKEAGGKAGAAARPSSAKAPALSWEERALLKAREEAKAEAERMRAQARRLLGKAASARASAASRVASIIRASTDSSIAPSRTSLTSEELALEKARAEAAAEKRKMRDAARRLLRPSTAHTAAQPPPRPPTKPVGFKLHIDERAGTHTAPPAALTSEELALERARQAAHEEKLRMQRAAERLLRPGPVATPRPATAPAPQKPFSLASDARGAARASVVLSSEDLALQRAKHEAEAERRRMQSEARRLLRPAQSLAGAGSSSGTVGARPATVPVEFSFAVDARASAYTARQEPALTTEERELARSREAAEREREAMIRDMERLMRAPAEPSRPANQCFKPTEAKSPLLRLAKRAEAHALSADPEAALTHEERAMRRARMEVEQAAAAMRAQAERLVHAADQPAKPRRRTRLTVPVGPRLRSARRPVRISPAHEAYGNAKRAAERPVPGHGGAWLKPRAVRRRVAGANVPMAELLSRYDMRAGTLREAMQEESPAGAEKHADGPFRPTVPKSPLLSTAQRSASHPEPKSTEELEAEAIRAAGPFRARPFVAAPAPAAAHRVEREPIASAPFSFATDSRAARRGALESGLSHLEAVLQGLPSVMAAGGGVRAAKCISVKRGGVKKARRGARRVSGGSAGKE